MQHYPVFQDGAYHTCSSTWHGTQTPGSIEAVCKTTCVHSLSYGSHPRERFATPKQRIKLPQLSAPVCHSFCLSVCLSVSLPSSLSLCLSVPLCLSLTDSLSLSHSLYETQLCTSTYTNIYSHIHTQLHTEIHTDMQQHVCSETHSHTHARACSKARIKLPAWEQQLRWSRIKVPPDISIA